MVMMGALSRSEATVISPDMYRGVVRTKTKSAFTEINLKGFELGKSAGGKTSQEKIFLMRKICNPFP
jgi:hypothetical protein